MVGLGAGGINFASHLLYDETEFLSRIRFSINRVKEILAVLTEPDFLFVDVQFLEIKDHLPVEAK